MDKLRIKNNCLSVEISAPGSYYKGSRFDWNGFITQVILDDEHTFCVPESLVEGIGTGGCGFCGEFGIQEPVGYYEAKVGDCFPKIGVGNLIRNDLTEYDFFKPYQFKPYNSTVITGIDGIEFISEPDDCNGYAFLYKKHITLDDNRIKIHYILKNTGEKAINTTEYCHNFIGIDNQTVGSDYVLKLPYNPVIDSLPLAIVQDCNELSWKDKGWSKDFYCIIKGYGKESPYAWELINKKAGVGLREMVSFEPLRIALWGMAHVISPEVFINIDVQPGEEQTWSRQYEFFKQS